MSKHRLMTACSLLATLAGCAAPPPAPPVAGAPMPLVKYDGNYQGRSRLVSSKGVCPSGRYGVIEIVDHTLNFAYQPGVLFVTDVAADGSLHQVQGTATLDGKIDGGRLAMTIRTPVCETAFKASVVWNHG